MVWVSVRICSFIPTWRSLLLNRWKFKSSKPMLGSISYGKSLFAKDYGSSPLLLKITPLLKNIASGWIGYSVAARHALKMQAAGYEGLPASYR